MDRRKFVSRSIVTGIAGMTLAGCASQPESATEDNDIMPLAERKKWLAPFSCNIEQWFRPMPFVQRFAAAKDLGFSAVEIWGPGKPDSSPQLLAQTAKENGLRVTTISPGAPKVADPDNLEAFLEWTDYAIEMTQIFGLKAFNLTGHKLVDGFTESQMIDNYIYALKLAAPKLEAANIVATIEPYNPFNHPGHFVYGVEPALSIARAVNSPNVKLNWDFFHMQRTNGNLITHLENAFDQVGYIQLADSPARNQPGTGEVAYEKVLTKLRELGYQGHIGAEFFPEDKDELRAASDLAKLAKRINLSAAT